MLWYSICRKCFICNDKEVIKEPNVIIITLLVLFNLVIDISKPNSSFSPLMELHMH